MAAESRRWKASAIVAVVVAAMAAAIVEGNYSIAMGGRRAIIDHIKGDNAAVRAGLCQVRDELIQESAPWRKWTMLKIHDGLSFQHSASATCGNPDLVPGEEEAKNSEILAWTAVKIGGRNHLDFFVILARIMLDMII